MKNPFKLLFWKYLYFIYFFIIPFIKSFSFLKEIDKNLINFIPFFKDGELSRILIQNENEELYAKEIMMECFNKENILKKYNSMVMKDKDSFFFKIEFNKYLKCKINSIISSKGIINYPNIEKPIFNFQEILNIQNNIHYKLNEIMSSFELNDFYIKSPNYNIDLHLIQQLNGKYIYSINPNTRKILLCKNNICFEFEDKKRIRKLKVYAGQKYYQLQNSTGNLIYEFDKEVPDNLTLKLTVIGEKGNNQSIEVSEIINNTKRAIFTLNDNKLTEGLYNVSFYDNDTVINDEIITLLIFKNELSIGEKKISYELIDKDLKNNFNLEIKLKEPIFKEQIYQILYKSFYNNTLIYNSNTNLTYNLSDDGTSLNLSLDPIIKQQFRNFTFYIYDNKDQLTNNSTLSFTLIVTHFIVLNPIIFMESEQVSQSLEDVTFQIKFASNVTNLNSNNIQIYIDGYKQLNGTNTFNNTSKEVYLTFTKNTTVAKEYFFVYNVSNYNEFRNIYLANYTMSGNCQLLPSKTDLFIDISYTNNLEGIIDIYFINSKNENIKFHRFTNSSNTGINLITYTYQLNKLYIIDEGQFNLIADSNILYLKDNYIDKDNLILSFFNKYTLNSSLNNNNTIYTGLASQNISLTFNENITDINKLQLINDNGAQIDSTSCSCNDIYTLICSFPEISNEKEGIYKINYTGLCGESIEINNSKVDIIYTNILTSINPPILMYNESSTINVTLKYKENLINDFNISNILLVNISNVTGNNITINKFIIKDNVLTFNASDNEAQKGIYYIYNNFSKSSKSYLSELKFKVTDINLTFEFNRYLFVLNNDNEEYKFEHLLTIKPSNTSLVSSICYQNKNKNLTKNNDYFFDILDNVGTYTFYYNDSEVNEIIPIDGIVYVVSNYTNLFNITPKISDCNFFYIKVQLAGINQLNTYLKNSILEIQQNNDSNSQANFTNQANIYIINFTNFKTDVSYTIKIFENNDTSQWIYLKNNVYFTNLSAPEYQFRPNTTITFKNVTCDFTKSSSTIQFKYENSGSKSVSCQNGNYDSNTHNLNCYINYNNIYGYHDIYINEDYNLSSRTFLSNSICDTYFEIDNSNSSISDTSNTITITNSNKDFYMSRIESIKYTLIGKETNEIPKTNGSEFIIYDNEYKMALIVNHGANYELLITNIKRKNENWENNNSNIICLYKEFSSDENNKYYHYLYKSEIPIIYINKNDTPIYPIEINFANKTFADNYKSSFNNINCGGKQEEGTVNCNFNISINQNIHNFSLTNLTNSETSKYVSLYYYYGDKCQLYDKRSNITISISSPVDLGNIILTYANDNLTQNLISSNSTYNEYNFTLSSSLYIEGKPSIFAIAEKIYTSPILLSDLDIFFYKPYKVESIIGTLLSSSKSYQKIIINFTSDINNSYFEGFTIIKKENDIQYQVDKFNISDDNNKSLILQFNSSEREVGEYELYLNLCDKKEPLGVNVSIIKFSSNRLHYVIDNNYNKGDISGLIEVIEGGKKEKVLYIEQYLDGELISKLIDNKNGTYSFPIKNDSFNYTGKHTFKFKNYESLENYSHDINITIIVENKANSFYTITGSVSESCYFSANFSYIFDINWINTDINHQVLLLGPNKTCDNNSCYSLIEGTNEKYNISIDNLGLQDGNLYHILVTENGDTIVPLYSYNFILSKIALTEPNERFFYLNAPYIKLKSNCSINLQREKLIFSRINDNIKNTITCNSSTIYNNDDNSITCYIDDKISEGESGYFNLTYKNYNISDKIFLSKAIEDAYFKISIPEDLKEGDNIINITSENFFLENLENYYINTTQNNISTIDDRINITPYIDLDNNSNSKIYITVNLAKNIPKYFWRIKRKYIDYDTEIKIQNYQDIPLRVLKVNLLSLQFSFDKVYIIEEAKDLCILDDDSYNKITITITSNYESDIDDIDNITVKYIKENSTESNNDDLIPLNKTDNTELTQYYYIIDDSNGLNYGIYKFYYGSKINEKIYPIDTYVLAVNKTEHIFKYSLDNTCIFKEYSPDITISNISFYFHYIDLTLIGFLLYDNNNGTYFKYNYKGNNYSLPTTEINQLNEFHKYTLIITEKDNRNCYVWKKEIQFSNNLTINSKFDFFYEDYILFENISCIGNITLKNENQEKEFELSCGEIDNEAKTIQCAYDFTFENKSYDTYQLYINGNLVKDRTIDIYNSILNGTFTVTVPETIFYNASATQIQISSNNDFDMRKITEVNITNSEDDEIIQCNENNTNCPIKNITNNSLIISPIFPSEKKYYVSTISRKTLEKENEGKNFKKIDILIENILIFNVDKEVIVLENNDDGFGNITITVSGNGKDTISYIYTNYTNGTLINLTKIENTDNYVFKSNIAQKYFFYYQLSSNKNNIYQSNITVQFFNKGTELFTITHDNNCVYKGQKLFIKIEYKDKTMQIKFKAFLNSTELVFEKNELGDYILKDIPSLEDLYEFIIIDSNNNNNIFYKSTKEYGIYTFSNLNNEEYYYIDYIYFTNVKCKFDLLSIKKYPIEENSVSFNLSCNDVSNNKIICKNTTEINLYGEYSIFYKGTDIGKTTFISNSLDKSNITLSPIGKQEEMEIEVNISSEEFYMKSLDSITIQSTIGETDKIIYNNIFTITSDNLSLTFNFTGTKGANYTLILNSKTIEDYPSSLSRTLDDKLIFISNFTLNEIFKSFSKSEENDTFNINLTFYDDNKERVVKSEKCDFNNDSQLICKLDNFKQEVRAIQYKEDINYFYIFTANNTGEKCSEESKYSNNASIIFYLNTPPEFEKNIYISFGGNNDDYECSNSTSNNNNLYTCYAIINTSSQKHAIIKIDSTLQNINLNTSYSTLKDFDFTISNINSLIEKTEDQQLILTFDYELSYKEFNSCMIYNSTNSRKGNCTQNNNKEINCSFNLIDFIGGDYNLTCESLCSQKNEIITIKKNISCDEPKISYEFNGTTKCGYCNEKADDENTKKEYFKDGTCITKEECKNYKDYALFSENDNEKPENKRCFNCSKEGKLIENTICVSMCGGGTIEYNNECFLPDDVEVQNYIEDDKLNYCNELCEEKNYENCDKQWNNCTCKPNFYGIYCEYNKNNTIINSINSSLNQIIDYFNENEDKDTFNTTIVAKVKSIINLLENNTISTNEIKNSDIFVNNTLNLLRNENLRDYNIYYFIELSLYFLKQDTSIYRRLNSDNTIDEILSLVHGNNIKTYRNHEQKKLILKNTGYKIFSDNLAQISWIWYNKSSQTLEDSLNKIKQYSSLSILDLSNCDPLLDDDFIVILTIIPISLLSYDEQYKKSSGIRINYSIFDNNDNVIKLNETCKSIIYISESILDYDIQIYDFYKKRGIDIYNKNDKAFTDPCFQSNKFNWDLTQKYRRNNLYQNITYQNENNICQFIEIDYLNSNDNNNFYINPLIKCEYNLNLNKNEIELVNSNDIIENNNKVYNLPFKCFKKVKNIHKNIGFWLYFIIIILYITSFIINSFLDSSLNAITMGAKNDKFIQSNPPKNSNDNSNVIQDNNSMNNSKNNNNTNSFSSNNFNNNNMEYQNKQNMNFSNSQTKNYEDNNSMNEKNIDSQNKNFIEPVFYDFPTCLIDNLFSLHPLLRMLRCSIISPLMITHFIFLFNISTLFAFNAILLPEKRIERKIWDKGRDKFVYPMKHEFGRIILSILISMLFTFIIRAVSLVSYTTRTSLGTDIFLEYNKRGIIDHSKYSTIKTFTRNHQVFKTICAGLIFLISIFYWSYTIVWCYAYYNAQFGWFYSGIWSLFWVWIVFAPIYIIILSILEIYTIDNVKLMYYLKNLFFF